ncbi:MAG: glycosyltransferase [Muribaculaceae bacterium]|nr:glycosyltransferase [Muribaculaceae bacterium]
MKLLIVANMYPSVKDPVYGTFVYNFVQHLKSLNPSAQIDVVTIYGRRNGYIAKMGAYCKYYAESLKVLLRNNYDLVYVHTVTFPIIPIRLALIFKRLPLVFNVHGDDVLPSNALKRTLKRLARPVVRKARMIVCPSSYFADVVKREFPGVTDGQLFVSPSGGVDPMFFVEHKTRSAGQPLTLGFVSRIDPGKNWEMFIEAISQIREQGIDCRGIIAGRGAQVDMMKQMITAKRLNEFIDHLGPVPQTQLPSLYSSMDLFVFPTTRRAESLGLVGLEAMAAGTPVIASNMAGPKTYITDGIDGYLFNPGDTNSLVSKILEYTRLSEENQVAMQKAARNTSSRFEASIVAAKLNDAIKNAID